MAIVSPRASEFTRDFPPVEIDWHDEKEHRRKLAEGINNLGEGKLRSTGRVTLAPGVATTVLNDARIGPSSYVGFSPLSANAKAEGDPWRSNQGKGTVTLNHANNAQVDRTYDYVVLG